MLAITNGTVIDGRGSDPLEGAVVLIEGERITAVGKRAHVNIPRDATVIDAAGGSILMCCGLCSHRPPCACYRRFHACERPWKRVSPPCATRAVHLPG